MMVVTAANVLTVWDSRRQREFLAPYAHHRRGQVIASGEPVPA
jgi:hypothetical protein